MNNLSHDDLHNFASDKRAPRFVTFSAWAIPVLVLTGWALLAAIPVTLLVLGTLLNRRVRALRWWSALVAVLYAIPFIAWLNRTDPAASMSSLLHPAMAIAIATAALIVILKIWKNHRGARLIAARENERGEAARTETTL